MRISVREQVSGVFWLAEVTGKTPPHGEQFFQREFLKRRMLLQKTVEVVDIGLEMTIVVQVHCLLVNEGLEGVVRVGERCVYEWIIAVSVHGRGFLERLSNSI